MPDVTQTTVTKTTRAGSRGKLIRCPHCNNETKVFHFSWFGLICQHCRASVPKYEWLLTDKPVNKITIKLDEDTWTGLLFHLRDTVEHIPVSTVEPDLWDCVTKVINVLENNLRKHD